MAKLHANAPPKPRKRDTRFFTGTCSNCRKKKVEVTKVFNAQVCEDCLGITINKLN